ncbi:unnamed protein product, partial [Mycena citricolor]
EISLTVALMKLQVRTAKAVTESPAASRGTQSGDSLDRIKHTPIRAETSVRSPTSNLVTAAGGGRLGSAACLPASQRFVSAASHTTPAPHPPGRAESTTPASHSRSETAVIGADAYVSQARCQHPQGGPLFALEPVDVSGCVSGDGASARDSSEVYDLLRRLILSLVVIHRSRAFVHMQDVMPTHTLRLDAVVSRWEPNLAPSHRLQDPGRCMHIMIIFPDRFHRLR